MLKELLGKKAYFLGVGIEEIETEKFFNSFLKGEKYYVTKDEEIRRYRRDLDGKCIVHNIIDFKFPSNSIVFVPQASAWEISYYNVADINSDNASKKYVDNPWERYVNFAEKLFSNGAEKIIFGYIEEDAYYWKMDTHAFITKIEKEFYDRGYANLAEISYKNKVLLCVDSKY